MSKYGRYTAPAELVDSKRSNPYRRMAEPYIRNIFATKHERPGVNFGAMEFASANNKGLSAVYPTRSENAAHAHLADTPKLQHYDSGASAFDSERTGLVNGLDEYITGRRRDPNNPLPYDPYSPHSVDNIRRPSSPSPQKYRAHWLRNVDPDVYNPDRNYDKNRQRDLPRIHALNKLSDQTRRFGPNGQAYAAVTKDWLENEGTHINMLSERSACNKPGDLGCSQFLPTIMPERSNYGYTSESNDSAAVAADRHHLLSAFNEQKPLDQQIVDAGLARGFQGKRVVFRDGGHVTHDKDLIALMHRVQKYLDLVRN